MDQQYFPMKFGELHHIVTGENRYTSLARMTHMPERTPLHDHLAYQSILCAASIRVAVEFTARGVIHCEVSFRKIPHR
jgi:hypothetical protein